MSLLTLCLLLMLPQVAPDSAVADTSPPPPAAADSVVSFDRVEPFFAPPAQDPPTEDPPTPTPTAQTPPAQEAPADTAAAPRPDTAVVVVPQLATADTARAAQADEGPTAIDALIAGLDREVDRLQGGIAQQFDQVRRTFTLTRLLLAVFAIALTFLLVGLAVFLLEWLARWRPALAPRLRKSIPLVRFGLWLTALWVLVGSLFGGSGLLLVLFVLLLLGAVAFVLFQFLRDFVGGLVLLVEQPFQVGSRVTVGEQEGAVEKIGLRSFRLRTSAGETVVVPNAEVLRRSIRSNAAETPEERVSVRLPLPPSLDVDVARQLAREAAYASPYVFLGRPVSIRLADAEHAGRPAHLAVAAYVVDGRYAEALANDVLRLAHAAFEEAAAAAPVRPGEGAG